MFITQEYGNRLNAAALHEVGVQIGPDAVRIVCSSPAVARQLRHKYGDARPSVNEQSYIFTLHVVHSAERMLFWRDVAAVKCFASREENPDLMSFFSDAVLGHEYFSTQTPMSLHAAVVESHGRAAAIVGASTAGKTTTAVACACNGMTLYSDERCILDKGVLYPFLRAVTLRPGCRRLLQEGVALSESMAAMFAAWPSGVDVSIRPSDFVDAPAVGPGRLHALFLLDGYGAEPLLKAVSPLEVLPRIMQSVMMREIGFERVTRMLDEVVGVPVFLLTLGNPSATARAIASALHELVPCTIA